MAPNSNLIPNEPIVDILEPLIALNGDLSDNDLKIKIEFTDQTTLNEEITLVDPHLFNTPANVDIDRRESIQELDINKLQRSDIVLDQSIGKGSLNFAFEAKYIDETEEYSQNPARRRLAGVLYDPTLNFVRYDNGIRFNEHLANFRFEPQAFGILNNDRVPGIPVIIDIKAARIKTKIRGINNQNFLVPVVVMEKGEQDLSQTDMSPYEIVKMSSQITIGQRYIAAKFSMPAEDEKVHEPIFKDIKPRNIIKINDYDQYGEVISSRYAMIDAESLLFLPNENGMGGKRNNLADLINTPLYSAPELFQRKGTPIQNSKLEVEAGRAKLFSAQYSLGVTLLDLLSRKPGQPVSERSTNIKYAVIDEDGERVHSELAYYGPYDDAFIDLEEVFPEDTKPNVKKFFSRVFEKYPKNRFENLAQFQIAFMIAMKEDKLITQEQFDEQLKELGLHEKRLFKVG